MCNVQFAGHVKGEAWNSFNLGAVAVIWLSFPFHCVLFMYVSGAGKAVKHEAPNWKPPYD
jgi:hypothetical protein